MIQIRYAIADEHNLFRKGIISLLAISPQLKLVMEASDSEEILEDLPKYKPDILLMGVRMSERGGVETLKKIRKKTTTLRLLY